MPHVQMIPSGPTFESSILWPVVQMLQNLVAPSSLVTISNITLQDASSAAMPPGEDNGLAHRAGIIPLQHNTHHHHALCAALHATCGEVITQCVLQCMC